MATVYGANATKRDVDVPSQKLDVTEQHGRLRRAYDSITLAAELTAGDFINFMKLPAGAKICYARYIAPVGGGADGIVKVGYSDNGVDAADDNALFAAAELDFGAGALNELMLGTAAGYNKKLGAETQIVAEVTETTTGSSGETHELEVWYVVD